LHLEYGKAGGVAAEVDGGDDAAGGGVDRDGEGAEANFVLLIDESVAVAADVAQGEAKLFDGADGARGVGDKVDVGEVVFELLDGEVGEQDAAHAGAVGGETAADVEVDGHNSVDLGAGDVDDVFAVEGGDGERFAEGGGHALKDGLGGGGEGVGRGVGMGEGEHARTQRVAGAVFGAGKAELGEGVETAADSGAGEASFDAELGDGHLRGLLGEGLDDDESAGERGHEVGVADVDVESGGGSRPGARGGGGGNGGGWSGEVRGEAHAGSFRRRLGNTTMFDRRTFYTINAHWDCCKEMAARVGCLLGV
jgi:hypothetical protein